jgi:hypothetical protein
MVTILAHPIGRTAFSRSPVPTVPRSKFFSSRVRTLTPLPGIEPHSSETPAVPEGQFKAPIVDSIPSPATHGYFEVHPRRVTPCNIAVFQAILSFSGGASTAAHLAPIIRNPVISSRLSPAQISVIFQAISDLLLTDDPIFEFAQDGLGFDSDLTDPAFSELSAYYSLFLSFLATFPDSPLLTFSIVSRLLHLCQLPDPRERNQISTILIAYYDVRASDQPQFIRQLTDALHSLRTNHFLPFAGMPLLACARHVLETDSDPHSPLVLELIDWGILPLLSSTWASFYARDLANLIGLVISSGRKPGLAVLDVLQKTWPRTCARPWARGPAASRPARPRPGGCARISTMPPGFSGSRSPSCFPYP